MKDKINDIERRRKECGQHSITIDKKGNLMLEGGPETKKCGLYWIHTSYSLDELCKSTISQKSNAVDIHKLANLRNGLMKVIKQNTKGDFWIVYNGIGGSGLESDCSYGLRERILQEFRDNEKTGSLKIRGTSLSDLTKWKYSYVVLEPSEYNELKTILEKCWRLEYGWPILSNQ